MKHSEQLREAGRIMSERGMVKGVRETEDGVCALGAFDAMDFYNYDARNEMAWYFGLAADELFPGRLDERWWVLESGPIGTYGRCYGREHAGLMATFANHPDSTKEDTVLVFKHGADLCEEDGF